MKNATFLLSLLPALMALPSPAVSGEEAIPAHELRLLRCSNSTYSVLEAAAAGDAATLEARLAEGEDPEQVDELGNRPLHYAACGTSARTLQLLLNAGADPLAQDARGRTPRQCCQRAELAGRLQQAEKVRERELKMLALIASGDEKGVRAALAHKVSPNARAAGKEGYALQYATTLGHRGMVDALIKAGARVDAPHPETKRSALHAAASAGHVDIIRGLLAAKADPLLQASNGAYPLHDAIWNRHLEAVRALLPAYAAVNFNPKGGPLGSPLGMAIHYGRTDMVRAFLEAGFNPNDARLADEPPLILAVRSGRPDCVKLLLEAGADKHMRDARGKTAADYASVDLAALLR